MTFLDSLNIAKIFWSFIKELFFSKVESTKDRVKNLVLAAFIVLTLMSFIGGVSLRDIIHIARDDYSGKFVVERREYWHRPEREDPLLDFMERNLRVQLREAALLQLQLEESLERIEESQRIEETLREQVRHLTDELKRIEGEFQSSGNPREMYDNLKQKPRG